MLVTGRRRENGVGLIEVLVAFAIFGVGVMGVFSSQMSAKKANYSAFQVSIATGLARDMLVRMRNNNSALTDYAVEKFGKPGAPSVKNCRTRVCSSSDLAASDLYEWGRLLNGDNERVTIAGVDYSTGGLVSPLACIRSDAGNIRVIISWLGHSNLAALPEPECGESVSASPRARSEISLATYIGRL